MIKVTNFFHRRARLLKVYYRLSSNPFNSGNAIYSFLLENANQSNSIQALEEAIKESEQYLENISESAGMADLYYDIGTAYSNLNDMYSIIDDGDDYLPIIAKNAESAFKYFRLSISFFRNGDLKERNPYVSYLKTSLYTNYANMLIRLGRYAEGIKLYYDVLHYKPDFDIAKGLLGSALIQFSNAVEPCLYTDYLKYYSFYMLEEAIESSHYQITRQTRSDFIDTYESIPQQLIASVDDTKHLLKNHHIHLDRKYRKWINRNSLYLSLLGDLEKIPDKYLVDDLRLPAVKTLHDNEPVPIFFLLFNQLKYDYLYARLKVYTSHSNKNKKERFINDSYLTDTNDDSVFNICVEDLKLAFSLTYSIFDKIASFINLYFDLEIKPNDVSFDSIWRNKKGGKNAYLYKNHLDYNHNMGLLCLYWINRDFKDCFGLSLDPENRIIKSLRNANEHRFIMVHNSNSYDFKDEYNGVVTHISYNDLEQYCMSLLSLVREAIIALTMAVYEENCYRENDYYYTLNIDDAIELGSIHGKDL